jgi:hypothetical protein
LKDGRSFGIFLGDGIASHMPSKSSSEDFLTLDGQVIKIDQTILTEENESDIMASPKHLKTQPSVFVDSHCDLMYEP